MIKIISMLLMWCILSLDCYAATYYIKNGGNDGSAGTSDGTAWENIDKIRTDVSSNDTVYLNRGDTWQDKATADYGAIHIISKNTITIGAYGTGDIPIVSCTGQTDTGADDGDFSDWNAIEIRNPSYAITVEDIWFQGGEDTMAAHVQNDNISYVTTFNRCRFGGVGQPSFQHAVVNVYGSQKCDFNDCTFSSLDTFNSYKYTQHIQYKVGAYGSVIGCEFIGIVGNCVRIVQYDVMRSFTMYWDKNYFHTPDLRDGGYSKAFKIRAAYNQSETVGATFIIRNNVIDWTGSGGMTESNTASMEAVTLPMLYPTIYYLNNTVVSDGEGTFSQSDPHATIYVYNNICYDLGYGNNNVDSAQHFRNNVWYSTPNIYDGTPGTDSGNVTTNPNIANASMSNNIAADANLTVTSTNSIDSGYGTLGAGNIPSDDYDGSTRVNVDIGAYMYPAGGGDGDGDGDTQIGSGMPITINSGASVAIY